MVDLALAAVLLATFDRCLGRMDERLARSTARRQAPPAIAFVAEEVSERR